jgi:5'-nucleotidase (lipoprotein e(P4) family)
MRRVFVGVCLFGVISLVVAAQAPPPAATRELGIKYFRDSEEYAVLARQVYRLAGDAVERARRTASGAWAVVLDVDETTLDNSMYQVERAVYGLPFEAESWSAWVQRKEAAAVPGVKPFLDRVRSAGGRVAFITNRDASLMEATRANLASVGAWSDDDRLCLQKPEYPKAARRAEVVKGSGDCAWPNTPMRILAFVGDQLGDFPDAAEAISLTGTDEAFGSVCFLLPNPMYGNWTARVTRQR